MITHRKTNSLQICGSATFRALCIALALALIALGLLMGACDGDDWSSGRAGTSNTAYPLLSTVRASYDIPYTEDMSLDVFSPIEAGDWPVVVAFHGAGRTSQNLYALAEAVAERGTVVFLPDWHSVQPGPETVAAGETDKGWREAACAIRFARLNASLFGADPDRLIVVGHSMGATVAAVMALAGDDFRGECSVDGGSALPDGFVGLDGPMNLLELTAKDVVAMDPEAWSRINPYTYLERVSVREGVEFRFFAGNGPITSWYSAQEALASTTAFAEKLKVLGYETSVVQLDHGHMEMAGPLPEVVDAIYQLTHP